LGPKTTARFAAVILFISQRSTTYTKIDRNSRSMPVRLKLSSSKIGSNCEW
jgi:hypothetical protein